MKGFSNPKRLIQWSRVLIVLILTAGLFLPLSFVQAEESAGEPSITIYFTEPDTAICKQDAGPIEATVVVSIPSGEIGKLVVDWYVVQPPVYPAQHHYVTYTVQDGDQITFTGEWPGVNPGDDVVEIHFGGLLYIDSVIQDTASLDYYWYEWVCKFDPTPTPTPVEPTPTPTPVEPTPTPIPPTPTPDGWDKSSLYFKDGCSGDCDQIYAEVCNGADSRDMAGSTVYQVYFIEKGNPKNGTQVASGVIPALSSGECITLSFDPALTGNYMFRAEQRPGHPGKGDLWSDACSVVCTE